MPIFCTRIFRTQNGATAAFFCKCEKRLKTAPKNSKRSRSKAGQDYFYIQTWAGLVLPAAGDILPYAHAVQRHSYREWGMDRRTWLKLAASTAGLAAFPLRVNAQINLSEASTTDSQPFSEELLDAFARRRADEPYKGPERRVDEALAAITYEQYARAIVYKGDQAIWRKDDGPFWLEPYHTAGALFSFPVELYTVDAGRATRIPYSADAFEFNPPAKQPATPAQSDFAGFRALSQIDKPGVFRDFLSFLGASNFRAIASGQVFGVTARALAINTGQTGGEDVPLFRSFWIERPKPIDLSLIVHALLDSQSAVGRYKFTVTPGFDTIIETETVIYPRRRIPYAGIAPIASRFSLARGSSPNAATTGRASTISKRSALSMAQANRFGGRSSTPNGCNSQSS